MKILMILLALVMAGSVRAEVGDRMELRKDIRASNAAEFKEKLLKIKDEKKRLIVEKLDSRFNEVNVKRTAKMTKHLDRMSSILDKVTGDVTSARTAIQTARDAVVAQTEKIYVITINTEANLKTDVGKVRSQLEADLKAVNELVVAARKAVQAILK